MTEYPETKCFLAFDDGPDSFAFEAARISPQTSYPGGYSGGIWAISADVEADLKEYLRDLNAVEELHQIINGDMARDDRGRMLLHNNVDDRGWALLRDLCDADDPVYEVRVCEPGGVLEPGPWVPTTMRDLCSLTSMYADDLLDRLDILAVAEGAISVGEGDGCFLPGDLAGGSIHIRRRVDPIKGGL